MSALHKQPYPSSRAARSAWLEGEIRRQHSQLLAMIPPLNDGDASLSSTWEVVAMRAMTLWADCSELAGLKLP